MSRVIKSVNTEAVPRKLPTAAMIRSILVPIDFSGPSDNALEYAISLVRQFDAKLILLHVVQPFPTPDFDYYPIAMESEKVMSKGKQRLEQVAAKAGVDPEVISQVLVRIGVPYREITDAARTSNVDLIVIATHGYTGVAHVFMGSTAERVVRHAQCSVLVVRGQPDHVP
jgi:universal stress protein A